VEARKINSYRELKDQIKSEKRSFLLLYKNNMPQSDLALRHFTEAGIDIEDIGLFTADVGSVRDIHPAYGVTSAPSLLEFRGDSLKNIYKGAHDPGYYRSLFENAVYVARAEKSGKPLKNVTVYTTPTCSWCTTLKSYLNNNQVRYTEIDVSRDENAAREMAGKSGQQGVPQTSVNGTMVVGFDKTKLNRLLEIEG
jgi:glutaredoxin-like YruB-family protein